jgi:hypothetical protein
VLLHDEEQEQLPRPNLRPLDDQRAAFAQSRVGFQQHLPILEQLKIDPITVARNAAGIDMEGKMFAYRQPIGLAVLQRFTRLADHFELVVTEGPLQRSVELMHLRRSRSWPRGIGCDDQSAPDWFAKSWRPATFLRLTRARRRSRCDQEGDRGESSEKSPAHRLLRGVVARQ